MKLYPALRSQMGSWNNYTVKMNARELSTSMKYASEVYENLTLGRAIQRIMNDGAVRREIAEYLKCQPDRFLSSSEPRLDAHLSMSTGALKWLREAGTVGLPED